MSEASKTPETTDLVDRLRTEQAYIIRYRQSIGAEGDYLCQEAANEIESLARRLRAAEEALDNAGVAKGAFGHSLRYRIGLLIERAEAAERRPSVREAQEEVREACLACCNPGSATDDISDDFHRGYMTAKRHVATAIRSLDLSKVGGEGKK